MPTHSSEEVPGNVTWSHLEMGLNGHEVIGDIMRDIGRHGGRWKLEEQNFLVSQP